MSVFRLAVTCPICDKNIIGDGWHTDSTLPDGVVNLDSFACERFTCKNCGTVVYTFGDAEDVCEYEECNLEEE